MTIGVPSSSVPAPSVPRIIGKEIGSCWAVIPRRVNRSCRLRLACETLTRTHPCATVGSGRSPTTSDASGSSRLGRAAYTANMGELLGRSQRPNRRRIGVSVFGSQAESGWAPAASVWSADGSRVGALWTHGERPACVRSYALRQIGRPSESGTLNQLSQHGRKVRRLVEGVLAIDIRVLVIQGP